LDGWLAGWLVGASTNFDAAVKFEARQGKAWNMHVVVLFYSTWMVKIHRGGGEELG
jgi:hypothetical protein